MTLWGLWYASLALAALSVVVMLVLVAHRVVRIGRDRMTEARRSGTMTALVGYLDGSVDGSQVLAATGGRTELLSELVIRMREIVRGEDAARLVDLARASGGFAVAEARLRRGGPQVRVEAVRHLAIHGRDAVPALTAGLSDPNAAVRVAAAVALTDMGSAPGLTALADALDVGDTHRSEELRQVFRPAVAADPQEAAALLGDDGSSDTLRMLLLDGLAQAGALEALDAVSAAARDASAGIRAEALRALAALGHPLAAPDVLAALSDPNWWVRAQAANAVRRIGVAEATKPLGRLLADEQWWVRLRAAEALSSLGEPGLASLRLASAGNDDAAEIARSVLAERGVA